MQLIRGNTILDVNGTQTFRSLEKMLEEKGYVLSGWHINLESKIDPNTQSPKLLVRFPSGKTIVLRFCNTISKLKGEIYSSEGFPPYDQLLFFAGDLLNDKYTLSHYNISAGFTLDAALVFRGELKVETAPEKTIYLQVHDDFTIRQVKDLFQRVTSITTDHQRLVNVEAGEELVDTSLLGSYLLRDMSILRLVEDTPMALRNEMKLYVKIVATGDTIELDVASDDNISSVKDMIQKEKDYPVGQQLLYLPQKRLEDKFTLAHYYIFDKATLHLAVMPEYHEGKEGSLQEQQHLTMISEGTEYHEGKEGIPHDQQHLTMNSEGNSPKRQKLSD